MSVVLGAQSGAHMANITGHSVKYVRPLHPPFTHFPVAAYVLAAGFDVISVIGGGGRAWAGQLWHAATFVLIAGLCICLVTMLTGFADLVRFAERRPVVMRTMAVHVCIQAGVFMIGVADVAVRIASYSRASTSPVALLLTIAAAIGVCTGGFFGGTLVYTFSHGVAVERGRESAPAVAPDGADAPARLTRAARNRPVTRHHVHGG
jgi:uncharacterized membrane protein